MLSKAKRGEVAHAFTGFPTEHADDRGEHIGVGCKGVAPPRGKYLAQPIGQLDLRHEGAIVDGIPSRFHEIRVQGSRVMLTATAVRALRRTGG
eukprot:6136752-Prymnesium_polylepis.1